MPDLDRTTLLKAIAPRLKARIHNLKNHGADICAEFVPQTEVPVSCGRCGYLAEVHDIRDANLLLEIAPSEAPAEAFTLGQAFVSRVTGADNQPDLSVMGAGDGLPMMFTPEQILDEAEMHAMDGEAGAMCAAMLTDYARLVRERHTGKG